MAQKGQSPLRPFAPKLYGLYARVLGLYGGV